MPFIGNKPSAVPLTSADITDGIITVADIASGTGGLVAWQSVQTTGFTAVKGRGYPCNTTSAAFTVTLPASPSAGDEIIIVDYAGTFDTNALTISPNGNKIEGGTASLQLTGEREGVRLVYIDSTQGWLASSGINEGTDALSPLPYSVDFLVIAGGGCSGGGGGGAGGYRNSYSTESSGGGGSSEASLTFNPGTVYTVTVGAGGTGFTSNVGGNGSNSSISGTGITTITSVGGGGGANQVTAGSGGSGGGANDAGRGGVAGSGTANQGFAGALGYSDTITYTIGGGGGGAGSAGSASSTTVGGNGGNGLFSSITGSSIGRGGGGGGAGDVSTYAAGTATSGGGNGSFSGQGSAGTANTGGGGGGQSGANGGSGVVIIRMPTANYSGTITGSPTVTTDGSDKVIVFNASGSITG